MEEIVNEISKVESEFGARLVRNAFNQLRRAVSEKAAACQDSRYEGLKSPLLSSKNRSAFTDAVCNFRRQLSEREDMASETSGGLMSATGAAHGSGLFGGSDGAITAMSD